MFPRAEAAPVRPILAALVVAVGTIAAAWGFQLIGGYLPCKLCLLERLPYYGGIPLLVVALLTARSMPRLSRLAVAAAGLAFFAGMLLAGYHAGVEWEFWPGPTDCGGGGGDFSNAGSLLAEMGKAKLISCNVASLRILGLSFAGMNAIVLALLAAVSLRAATGPTDRLV